jgi:predicted DNA-binding antitoxin AbrB/MazE fold protein
MTRMIETIFEKGVFRPLIPVAITENQRVKIHVEDSDIQGDQATAHPRLEPLPYPDDFPEFSEAELAYSSPPPKAVLKISADCTFTGKLPPSVYTDE